MILGMSILLLWSMVARPVVIGTRFLKLLYDLRTLLQLRFQVLALLLQSGPSFWRAQFTFQIHIEFFALRCHVELPVHSVNECDCNTMKFNMLLMTGFHASHISV